MKYENDDREPQTRQEYRKYQQGSQDDFAERDQRIMHVQREYSRTHRGQQSNELPQDNFEEEPRSRSNKSVTGDQKVYQLKRKLNIIIIGLVLAIIIVYLVLFFVG